MSIRDLMKEEFRIINGGLFETVKKADVGNAADIMMKNGVDMLCWADPFFPDKRIPKHVKEAAQNSFDIGVGEHYTTPIGNPVLKELIAKKLEAKNNMKVDRERNIIITPGSDSGLCFSLMPFIEPGDEVLIVDPSYPNNFQNIKLLGGIPVSVPVYEENGFELEIEEFESRVTEKTKMVLLTNPNNPTTVVYSEKSLKSLADFVAKHDLAVVVDQAFEDIIFDEKKMITFASLPGMFERTVTVFSISKGMGLSGLRVGYVVACDKVIDVLFGCAVSIIGATNSSGQLGAIAAFEKPEFINEYKEIFDRRRKMLVQALDGIKGVSMQLPQSSFLSWINVSQIGTSQEIVDYLVKEAKVFVNAGYFYGKQGEGYLRMVQSCYGDDARLETSLYRMRQALIKRSKEVL